MAQPTKVPTPIRTGEARRPQRMGRRWTPQHYSDANGTVGTAESSNGNRYATANGNAYKNTGSGWQSAGSGSDAHGWGGSSGSGSQSHSGNSSAFSGWGGHSGDSGGGGWGSASSSSQAGAAVAAAADGAAAVSVWTLRFGSPGRGSTRIASRRIRMCDLVRNRFNSGFRPSCCSLVAVATLLSTCGLQQKEQPTTAQASPKTFASPEDAGKGLFRSRKIERSRTLF